MVETLVRHAKVDTSAKSIRLFAGLSIKFAISVGFTGE